MLEVRDFNEVLAMSALKHRLKNKHLVFFLNKNSRRTMLNSSLGHENMCRSRKKRHFGMKGERMVIEKDPAMMIVEPRLKEGRVTPKSKGRQRTLHITSATTLLSLPCVLRSLWRSIKGKDIL